MEGDSCSRHADRMAVGFYSGSSYGLNGCSECIKNNAGAKIKLYNLSNCRKIWVKNQAREKKQNHDLLVDDSKSLEVSTNRGSHWILFGKDKINYLKDKSTVTYAMKFLDDRSNFYDSSD